MALLPLSMSVWAWGCEGHQAAALIAMRFMDAAALEHANALLRTFPIAPELQRFCREAASLPAMADASTWADDVRNKSTAAWHFQNVPLGFSGDFNRFCGLEGCVSRAVKDQFEILKSEPDNLKRTDALRFLIHFVGDLHQPLHMANNNDRGGNCVPVIYLKKRPVESNGQYRPELHGIWDSQIVKGLMKTDERRDVMAFADLLAEDAWASREQWENVPMAQWANESHALAESMVYGALLPDKDKNAELVSEMSGPGKLRQCSDGGTEIKDLNLKIKITAAYEKTAEAVVKQQLQKAGVRLAMLLNQALDTPTP